MISADSRHAWLMCSDGIMFELDAATGTPIRVLTGPRYQFNRPDAIAADGTRVWVANYGSGVGNARGGSVTELNAATGAPIRVLTESGYGFNGPSAIALDGTRVWVTNDPYNSGGSVTELNAATGAPIRVLTGPSYPFSGLGAIATDGTRVWVTNTRAGWLTEFPESPR
jgi:DNA-binding beta-propeller fold protein YncE